MASWIEDELNSIGTAELLELTAAKADGSQLTPVTVWVVRHRDDLYVRSWRGNQARWFQAVRRHAEGRIVGGGVVKDVAFVTAGDEVNDALNDAYRRKYRRYADSYLAPMIAPQARATTLKLVPRQRRGTA